MDIDASLLRQFQDYRGEDAAEHRHGNEIRFPRPKGLEENLVFILRFGQTKSARAGRLV